MPRADHWGEKGRQAPPTLSDTPEDNAGHLSMGSGAATSVRRGQGGWGSIAVGKELAPHPLDAWECLLWKGCLVDGHCQGSHWKPLPAAAGAACWGGWTDQLVMVISESMRQAWDAPSATLPWKSQVRVFGASSSHLLSCVSWIPLVN